MIVFLDLETGGLEETECGIVQIGASKLLDSTCCNFFRACRPAANLRIEQGALDVNGETVEGINDVSRLPESIAVAEFIGWLRGENGDAAKVQFAGWNIHFDFRHLCAALKRSGMHSRYWPCIHRLIDLHTMVAIARMRGQLGGDPLPVGEWAGCVMNSDHASTLIGIPEEPKPHNALKGALQAREMFRRLMKLE